MSGIRCMIRRHLSVVYQDALDSAHAEVIVVLLGELLAGELVHLNHLLG